MPADCSLLYSKHLGTLCNKKLSTVRETVGMTRVTNPKVALGQSHGEGTGFGDDDDNDKNNYSLIFSDAIR